jgi:hypothetical protein
MEAALEVMDAPWRWGHVDCCTAACDVFYRLYGIDPMRSVRGTYATRGGAARLIASYGGMKAMAATLAEKEGLVLCEPRAGAIGVTEKSLVVCVSDRTWIGKTETGFSTLRHVDTVYHVAV